VPSGSAPTDSSSPDAHTPPRPQRWARRAARGLGGLIATLLLGTGLLLLVLQTETGATAAAQFLARQANPLPNTTLTVERASGSWVRSLRLSGVSLTRPDSTTGTAVAMAQVDTLAVAYRLGALLRGRLHLSEVSVHGPSLTLRQAADSSWDWARALANDAPAAPDDTSAGRPIRIDRVRVADGRFAAQFYAGGRDSTARIRDLTVRARALRLAPTLEGRLDTLGLRAALPADTSTLRLAARAALSDRRLDLDTLRLTSPRSDVAGRGTVRLPLGPHDTLDDVALSLQADPLVLGDLSAFVPALAVDPEEALALDARLTGSGQRLSLYATAEGRRGGRLTATATATPRLQRPTGAPPLYYAVDATLRDVSTSLLGPSHAAPSLTATLQGTLKGPTLNALDGTLTAQVDTSRLFGVSASALTLRAAVEAGTASVALDGTVNDVALAVDGTARPFDAAPSMDLTAQVRDLSLAALTPNTGVEGRLTSTAHITGQSMATDTARYAVDATLSDARLNALPIASGRLSGTLAPDRLDADATLRFPTGQMRLAGHAALDGTERFVLETGRLEAVDVAALVGDTTASQVSATLSGSGQGFSATTAEAQGTLAVQDARYGPHRLSSLTARTTLADGQARTEASATLNGSQWTLSARGQPFADVPSVALTEARFRALDIGPFLQDTTQSSALRGTLSGRLRGTAPDALRASVRVALDNSRLNRQRISGATLDATVRDRTVQSTLALDTPEGGVDLALTARPFGPTPTYRLSEGTFENLDVGALAGIPGLSTGMSGTLRLTGRGAQGPGLRLDAGLALEPSIINRAEVSEGRLSVAAADRRIRARGRATGADGTVQFRGHLDSLRTRPAYAFRGRADSVDVGALAGLDSLRARLQAVRWSVDGRGTTPRTLTASARVAATAARVGSLRLDTMSVAGRFDRGLFRTDTLALRSNAGTVRGHGPLALIPEAGTSDFEVRATVTDAAPLRPLLAAPRLQLRSATARAHVYGTGRAQRFDGTLALNGLLYNDIRLSDLSATFRGQRDTAPFLDRLAVQGEAGYLSAFGLTATRTQLDATYDGTTASLTTTLRLDETHRITLAAAVAPAATPLTIRLRDLQAQLGPDLWTLQETTALTVGTAYRVDDLRLASGTQRMRLDGVVAPSGTQHLDASLSGVRLGGITPLMGLGDLAGTVTAEAQLRGDATAPTLNSDLQLRLQSEGREVGTLRLSAGYDDLQARLDGQFTHTTGRRLSVDGTVPTDLRLYASTPVDLADAPVRLNATTDRLPVDWIDPLFDPATVRSVRGMLTADVAIRGTRGAPNLSGSVSLSEGGAYLPALQTTYRDGAARLQLSDNRLVLEDARLRTDNNGILRADGLITLPELTVGEYDLSLTASNLLAINTPAYRRAVVDGRMTLRGTVRRPVLTGTVQIQRADVFYADALAQSGTAMAPVSLSAQDQVTLEERFGLRLSAADTTTFDAYRALALDLGVQIESDTWLRSTSNPEMNVQFTGDLDVEKAANADAQVFGSIEVVDARSTLRQFGQEFQITQGTLTFNGDPALPYLDLTAVYEQRAQDSQESEVRITLSLSGRPDALSPTLSSEPSMDTRNILSYLATGRPADALFSGNSEGGSLATQVALGQASNFVENLAASELGLDVVRLNVRTEGASYLTVGRYLTPRFFASIEQPVLSSSAQTGVQSTAYIPDVTLEYQLTDVLQLRSRSSQESLQLDLFFEYAY
jgi:translocation and assembly module TamB